MVSYCDQSLSVVRALSTFSFKWLLQNGWTDFEIILQEGSLGDPHKIAQTVPLRWTRWPPELKIEKPLYDFPRTRRWIFMPPTSEKLRGHIGLGLSICLSVLPSVRNSLAAEKLKNHLCWNLEIILCGMYMKNKRTRIFFSSTSLVVPELCPFFD